MRQEATTNAKHVTAQFAFPPAFCKLPKRKRAACLCSFPQNGIYECVLTTQANLQCSVSTRLMSLLLCLRKLFVAAKSKVFWFRCEFIHLFCIRGLDVFTKRSNAERSKQPHSGLFCRQKSSVSTRNRLRRM